MSYEGRMYDADGDATPEFLDYISEQLDQRRPIIFSEAQELPQATSSRGFDYSNITRGEN